MFNANEQRAKRQGGFMSAVEGFSTMCAGVAAFFLAPEIYSRTIGFVVNFTAERYGPELANVMPLIWFVVVSLMTFFISSATLRTAIVAGGLAIAIRFV